MKRIYLQKIVQHNTICYIGKANPQDLVKVATKIEVGEIQDAQRPLNKKRLREIGIYIESDKGILPNTLTLATKDKRFDVKALDENTYFIDFPNTKDEFPKYEDAIEVMDGQHRLYSFWDDFRKIKDDVNYEIGFTLYIEPTLEDRRRIFISCNEKQEKVSGNLLMWFRKRLGMLNEEDAELLTLVEDLNNNTPLKGRIIMSAEKIKNGIKAKEIIAIFKKPKFRDMSVYERPFTRPEKFEVIRKYLKAWENVVGFSFQNPRKEDGAATKTAGLRYMLLLLPYIWQRTLDAQKKPKDFEEFFTSMLTELIGCYCVSKDKFFTCDENKLCFRDRTATEEFVKESVKKLQKRSTERFDPFAS